MSSACIAEDPAQIGSREGGIYIGNWFVARGYNYQGGFSGFTRDQVRGSYYRYNDKADALEDGEVVVSPALTTQQGDLIPILLERLPNEPHRIRKPWGGSYLIDLFFPYGDQRLEPCYYTDLRRRR